MHRLSNERGVALLIALAVMLMVGIVVVIAVDTAQTDIDLSFNQLHTDQAFHIAQAGGKVAFRELNANNDWRTGYADVAFEPGMYTVALEDSSTNGGLFDTVLILATGSVKNANSTVEFWTVPIYNKPFKYAMFADAGINLDQLTCTDSYNSDSGSYADTYVDSLGDIGTNGTISTSKDVTIGGDATSATPGGISLGSGTTVTGDTTTTADSVALDIVPDSEYDWAKTVSSAPAGLAGAGFTYNNGSKSLTLGSGSSLTLSGGVYYFSSITAGQDSEIKIAPGASVMIYVTGDIVLNQNSTFNAGGQPKDLLVFSQGSTLQFDQGNTFVGAFYGPNAHVQYDQTTQFYGSLMSNTIQLDKGACFHYDQSLSELTHNKTGDMDLIAWREQ